MADKLIIYTLPSCPTCKHAKGDLIADGVDFEERDITTNPSWYDEATDLSLTVPIILRGDKVEIGWKGEDG